MRTVEEHQRVVAGLITGRPPVGLPLADTLGLVLAEDVVAPLSLPGFDNSAMDGYAVVADDVAAATPEQPVLLPVAEDIPAGRTDPLTLKPGTAHRIMTGAPLPDGCNRRGARRGHRRRAPTPWRSGRRAEAGQHIRRAGEDVTAGTTVLRAGQVLTPAALGLAAALGLGELKVRSAATGTGDVDRLGTGRARHAAAAGTDLRVQRGDAGRGGARRRRRGGRRADDRRRRRDVPRRAAAITPATPT